MITSFYLFASEKKIPLHVEIDYYVNCSLLSLIFFFFQFCNVILGLLSSVYFQWISCPINEKMPLIWMYWVWAREVYFWPVNWTVPQVAWLGTVIFSWFHFPPCSLQHHLLEYSSTLLCKLPRTKRLLGNWTLIDCLLSLYPKRELGLHNSGNSPFSHLGNFLSLSK